MVGEAAEARAAARVPAISRTVESMGAAAAPLVICAMPDSDCPNGMCSRKPTGAAAETYGKPAAGKLEEAVFALG